MRSNDSWTRVHDQISGSKKVSLLIEMEESVRSHAELCLKTESQRPERVGAWALTSVHRSWGDGGLPLAQIAPCLFSPQDVLKPMSNSAACSDRDIARWR
jgi:hypothetical protein